MYTPIDLHRMRVRRTGRRLWLVAAWILVGSLASWGAWQTVLNSAEIFR